MYVVQCEALFISLKNHRRITLTIIDKKFYIVSIDNNHIFTCPQDTDSTNTMPSILLSAYLKANSMP